MLKHHIHHAEHHDVTTKTPREKGVFLENPQQKRPSTIPRKNHPANAKN
jgi:hypothetical protein